MIASIRALSGWHTSELAAEQNQRFIELAEIVQQRGGGLIGGGRVPGQVAMQIVLLIPAGMTDLDKVDSRFGLGSVPQMVETS